MHTFFNFLTNITC